MIVGLFRKEKVIDKLVFQQGLSRVSLNAGSVPSVPAGLRAGDLPDLIMCLFFKETHPRRRRRRGCRASLLAATDIPLSSPHPRGVCVVADLC